MVSKENPVISITKLNKILKDLMNIRNSGKRIERTVIKDLNDEHYGGEGSQGDSNEIYEVYPIEGETGLFIKLEIGSDSYGDNEFVAGIEIVRPVEKLVTLFEPIK